MSKIKVGSVIMIVSHGNAPKLDYPPIGSTGEILDATPDEHNRYKVMFPKEKLSRWKVARNCFIVIDDGKLDKITEEEDNPYYSDTPKQKEVTK